MVVRIQVAVNVLLVCLALCVLPASAQLASYVDEHGKRVFINANPPPPPRGSSHKGVGKGVQGTTSAEPGEPGNSRAAQQVPKVPPEQLDRLVEQTAEKHRVDPQLVRAVIRNESGWNPAAVSRRGALGLMQLVPGTAQRFGVADAFNPQQNLDGGVRYLRSLLERYKGDLNLSLAAYNAGEHAVDRARGVPNYPETRSYVQKVTDSYFRSDSGGSRSWWSASRPIYRATDEKGRIVFTNE